MSHTVNIWGREVGPGEPLLLIAEIGVNHNGSSCLARDMVSAAKKAGADCVKFQTFKASRVVSAAAPKSAYQLLTTDPGQSQLAMLQALEIGRGQWVEIMDHCRAEGMPFLSTPYNFEDADLLEELGAGAYKIASGQAVELPFLEHVARKGMPVLLSTGMCTLAEVARAVEAIRAAGNEQIVLLQCTTNYPSRAEDANLRAMVRMGEVLGVPVGYSDHTTSPTAPIAAVALGASVVERHFTLDKNLQGPDHSSSSDPAEFAALALALREAEACLGNGEKRPCEAERRNAPGMRRSLFAARAIDAGEVLGWGNLLFQRPAGGISGEAALGVAGRVAARAIPAGARLDLADVGEMAREEGE
jgi:N-acetylneuraminate synthase/N,N'-diacetyllegionaminate synthase